VTGSIALNIVVGSGTSVVINEFALRSQWGQFDDYVELRNDGAAAVDISGWQIREWIASSGSIEVKATVGSGVVLAPGCHYLASTLNATLGGVARDTNLSDLRGDGGLALVRTDGSIVDQVGMNPNSPFREGTPLRPTTADDSPAYTRAGNDTNDNASDFLTRSTRTPMNSASSCAVR
jgi:predicted extracellular nuclease